MNPGDKITGPPAQRVSPCCHGVTTSCPLSRMASCAWQAGASKLPLLLGKLTKLMAGTWKSSLWKGHQIIFHPPSWFWGQNVSLQGFKEISTTNILSNASKMGKIYRIYMGEYLGNNCYGPHIFPFIFWRCRMLSCWPPDVFSPTVAATRWFFSQIFLRYIFWAVLSDE